MMTGNGSVGGEGRRLDDARQAGAGGDLAGPDASVVPDAVDVDAEFLGRVDGGTWKSMAWPGAAAPLEAKPLIWRCTSSAERGRRRGGGGWGACGSPGGWRSHRVPSLTGLTGPTRLIDVINVIDVPRDDMARVVEVLLVAPEPGNGAWPRRGPSRRARVRPTSGGSAPDPMPAPLPRAPVGSVNLCPARDQVPAHHITHALRHRSSRIDVNGTRTSG